MATKKTGFQLLQRESVSRATSISPFPREAKYEIGVSRETTTEFICFWSSWLMSFLDFFIIFTASTFFLALLAARSSKLQPYCIGILLYIEYYKVCVFESFFLFSVFVFASVFEFECTFVKYSVLYCIII